MKQLPFTTKSSNDIIAHMTADVVAVVNQKGGVGKTTTAINLAAYLAELGHRTLLVDFDPQANATSGLGLKRENLEKTVYNLLHNEVPAAEALFPTPFDNLHVLPASTDLAGAEVELSGRENREYILSKVLDAFRPHYTYIVIDCAPSLGLLTLNALVAANRAIIPVQCEYFALEGIAHLMNTINLIKEALNPSLEVSGILLTMYDPRTSLNRLVVNNAKVFFKELVFDTIIPRNVRLAESPSHGLPIMLYQPDSKGSVAYLQLAKEFTQRVTP